MQTTIGEAISRVRNLIKSVNQDSFLTDRFIYGVIKKQAAWLLHREDGKNALMRFSSIFETLDLVQLIEVDKVEACCAGIKSGCYFMRSDTKLPRFMEGYWGPLIREVTSLDESIIVHPTTPGQYTKISKDKNFKYNKKKYYWLINNYIYFPNLDWDGIKITAAFDEDVSTYSCDDSKRCKTRQEQLFAVPGYLHGEMESNALKDLGFTFQLPGDPAKDKVNILRS